MARFDIIESEGMYIVKATLQNETVRAEAGALYFMRGPIQMQTQAPSMGGFFKSMATGETVFRPTYTGTGELFLEPSFGGFHIMSDLEGQEWILERGAYYASDGSINVDVYRDPAMTSFLSGKGLINFQTRVSGQGQVVIEAQGNVQVMPINNDRLVVDGTFVVARTASLNYRIERATKGFFSSMASGEGLVATYEGTGKVLISPVPFWRHRMYSGIQAAIAAARSAASSG